MDNSETMDNSLAKSHRRRLKMAAQVSGLLSLYHTKPSLNMDRLCEGRQSCLAHSF